MVSHLTKDEFFNKGSPTSVELEVQTTVLAWTLIIVGVFKCHWIFWV